MKSQNIILFLIGFIITSVSVFLIYFNLTDKTGIFLLIDFIGLAVGLGILIMSFDKFEEGKKK